MINKQDQTPSLVKCNQAHGIHYNIIDYYNFLFNMGLILFHNCHLGIVIVKIIIQKESAWHCVSHALLYIWHGHCEIVTSLLSHNANINAKDLTCKTCHRHLYIWHLGMVIVKFLVAFKS